jgi:hypothetical protein
MEYTTWKTLEYVEENIKMDFKGTGLEDVDLFRLVQDRDVKMVCGSVGSVKYR